MSWYFEFDNNKKSNRILEGKNMNIFDTVILYNLQAYIINKEYNQLNIMS